MSTASSKLIAMFYLDFAHFPLFMWQTIIVNRLDLSIRGMVRVQSFNTHAECEYMLNIVLSNV